MVSPLSPSGGGKARVEVPKPFLSLRSVARAGLSPLGAAHATSRESRVKQISATRRARLSSPFPACLRSTAAGRRFMRDVAGERVFLGDSGR
jgi:hypothetical protein